jgi:anhydro-N-acetylmuramic acid kinase
MSGTSADAIEVALASVSPSTPPKLLNHTTRPLSPAIRAEILRIAEGAPASAAQISQLNFRLGHAFAEAALAALKQFRVPPSKIALIGSHGQTIFHQGPSRSSSPLATRLPAAATAEEGHSPLSSAIASTLQIGEPAIIATRTGITTIADFRPADIAVGGQGAPLVPFADYLLYRHPKLGRVSLNLGGIANITVIPAGATPSQVFAFDTGPANMLIDSLVSHFSHGRRHFDKDARQARKGRSIPYLLNSLLRDPYLRQPPPKSTGREYYGAGFTKALLSLAKKHRARPNDLLHNVTLFTALSVVDALHRFVLPKTKIHQLIVSGGGAHNPLIMAQLTAALSPIEVLPSSQLGIPEDAKEAFAFALLAYENWQLRPGNLPNATGARRPAILGKISYAPPR